MIEQATSTDQKSPRVGCEGREPVMALSPSPSYPIDNIVRRTPELEEEILDLYLQGLSIQKISTHRGMPSMQTIFRWMSTDPTFGDRMRETRKMRAMYFEELSTEVVEAADESEGSCRLARLQMDNYKWRAEVSDPSTYGKKTTISGDKDNPIQFTIITGVPQPDPKPEEKLVEAIVSEESNDTTTN